MHPAPEAADATPKPKIAVAEVKYSLRQMLEELKAERASSTFAMEKLDQNEIGKLFKARTARAKSQK